MAKLNVKDTTNDAVRIRQDLFLRMYEKIGVITRTCESVGLHKDTVRVWKTNDIQGFRQRFLDAHMTFTESLEELAYDRVKQQKPSDNPTLLIALLNANHPDKYRPQSGATDEAARDLMVEMKKSFKNLSNEEIIVESEVTEEDEVNKLLEGKKEKSK
jgi:hypothetical protein|tara:strand:+ start:1709 stop:2182 length:474 start_codon:yes stop_codon:yes gene_type:complete